MKISYLPEVFTAAMPVLEKLEAAGYEAYFVGGCVRDLLIKRPIHDVDIATSAYPEEVKQTFAKSIDTGIQHGTVTVLYGGGSYEITTFRTESGYQDFRRPDKVTFVQNLDEDLKRRDFTINALAMNRQGEIVDLFDGLGDLDRHLIKAVGNAEERFHEDALRMMRAVRFMSQLSFQLEGKTRQAIVANHELLSKISVERIREEFVKLALGPDSRRAFREFLDTGLSEECPGLKGQKARLAIFPDLKAGPDEEAVFWSLIVIMLNLPVGQIAAFMREWKNSNAMSQQVKKIVAAFDLLSQRAASDFDLFAIGRENLQAALKIADLLGQPLPGRSLQDRYERLPIKQSSELTIDGQWLIRQGIKPSPALGQLLRRALTGVVEGKVDNDPDAIAAFLQI
ncbi:CCA-adding enzyme [Lactobacillus nasalidis]|uniref:CCA-adding enzyme n=1 Tax=Lactobacillus nasalidis TaxID=2797258 RepID=A0ABQ3W3S3_9LACO|nr:CCA tRNA nucleotidyltransferase [Lactobacillus nasalidis]GHV97575.1 CCA-adding enzyme [Lactobacillus nasalidis]GHV99526.1 CCA-adding enzyme [Lactobacillus nasalidis]GHW01100.1 CCA-adding enzyme [Lactobacillus nasalidis]